MSNIWFVSFFLMKVHLQHHKAHFLQNWSVFYSCIAATCYNSCWIKWLLKSDVLLVSELFWSLPDSDSELLLCFCWCCHHNPKHESTHIADCSGRNAQTFLFYFLVQFFLRLQGLHSWAEFFFFLVGGGGNAMWGNAS